MPIHEPIVPPSSPPHPVPPAHDPCASTPASDAVAILRTPHLSYLSSTNPLPHLTNMPRLRARAPPAPLTAPSATPTASSTRPRRGTANQSPAAAVIQRSSPEETRQSIHLTVKSSPGKLRQATSGAIPKTGVSRQNIVAGKRASRSSRIVREVDSEDEEDEDEDEDEAEEVDAMDVDEDEDEEDDVDAEGDEDEDMDAEGDEDDEMEDGTPASRIVVSTKQKIPVNPTINITKAQDSVEAKEMAMDDDDDDELSDPDSDLDEEDAEGEDEDAEGEEDDEMGEQNGDMDEEMDSDEDLSRGQTPDISKMTKRQRALVEEGDDGGLMALSNEAQKKKHLTAEENAMRRAEMARRRKNLSEKRNEEEKVRLHYTDTLKLHTSANTH
jgi:Ino eighty subunit 2